MKLSPSYNVSQIESLVRSQASRRLSLNEVIFVAESENNLVGFASLLVRQAQISGLYVRPNFTRCGIGTLLLKAVEKIAIDRGEEVIAVMSSLDAVNFYQACGYQLIGESIVYSEGKIWIPCLSLEKQLIIVRESTS